MYRVVVKCAVRFQRDKGYTLRRGMGAYRTPQGAGNE